MKRDLKPGWGDGPEREQLRAILRQWSAPAPPAEIEEELRRTFERRRSRRRRVVWLSLAAGLTLLALWQSRPAGRPVPPAPSERPLAMSSPVPPSPTPVEAERARPPAPVSPVHMPRIPAAPKARADVIVEPDQGALLAELGRKLRDVRQGVPGAATPRIETRPAAAPKAAIPPMPAVDAPRYRTEWETVAGEWPLVQRSVPMSRR